jgi:hypothetical protein
LSNTEHRRGRAREERTAKREEKKKSNEKKFALCLLQVKKSNEKTKKT